MPSIEAWSAYGTGPPAAQAPGGTAGREESSPDASTEGRLPRPPAVTCRACVVATDTGDVLWARRAHLRLPNASTTKMGTALLVTRRAELGETVIVSGNAAATGGGGLDLEAGQGYSVRGLLQALLLTSSNDAAVALAEHVSGSEKAFVADLNAFLHRLGARSTHYVTAHGLDAPGHLSTARDLATMAAALLHHPVLARMVAEPSILLARPDGTAERLVNSNDLLETYPGALGVKTGYTTGAGDVLVAAAERDDRTVIVVAMDSDNAADDDRRLLDFAFEQLSRAVLIRRTANVGGLIFDAAGATGASPARIVRGPMPREVDVRFHPRLPAELPVAPGEVVGTIVVTGTAGPIDRVPALATGGVMPGSDGGARKMAAGVIAGLLRRVGAVAPPLGAM
ncbi:MAG: D-alanyl-D-alanine carboxypeptidase [Actinobacteria bacterium]|nr:D-alanyl-D-alanine carboxypeptidase [Actinomycetota bacterium]